MKKTKIVCTIGPASWDKEVLKQMIDNGMNVARLNGAFIDIPEMTKVANLIRELSPDVALMLDIKGHELRLNKFDEDIKVNVGDEVVIGSTKEDKIYVATYMDLFKDIRVGKQILVDKAKTVLEVTKITDGKIYTKVLSGSVIQRGKGLNTPGTFLNNSPITDIDIEQINFAKADKWDFVAASFIRSKEDLDVIKPHLVNSSLKLIAKIEDGFGVENIDEIIESCDGIMVARGDLAVEVPYEKVPLYQKMMIKKCRDMGKIVITATEMLESMIEKPYPTRAEISDIANAVLDGTDALMLSGETTAGKYPHLCVEVMSKISLEMEKSMKPLLRTVGSHAGGERDAMMGAVYQVSVTTKIDKVVMVSERGVTATALSRHFIKEPIIVLTPNETVRRQLLICSNIYPTTYEGRFDDRDNAIHDAIRFGITKNILDKTDRILFLGKTNAKNGKENYIFEVVHVEDYA